MNSGTPVTSLGTKMSAISEHAGKRPIDLTAVGARDALIDRFFKGLFAAAGWLVLIVLIAVALSMLWEE